MSRFQLRPYQPEDAEELALAHIRIWNEAYGGLMPPEVLSPRTPELMTERWHRIIAGAADWPTDPAEDGVLARQRLAVDTESGRIAGFGTANRGRDEDRPVQQQLWALNVLSDYHGSGLSHLLIEELIEDLPAYLWVLQGNDRAIAFYRKHGFELDGVCEFDEGIAANELRMVRR